MTNHTVIIQSLQFSLEKRIILNDINITFKAGKYGLIGNNGCGKTTLLKLIIGQLTPTHGHITASGTIGYLPQSTPKDATTVADALGISHQLNALNNIENGTACSSDFDTLNNQWDIREQATVALHKFGLGTLNPYRQLHTLSGGQVTRAHLAGAFLKKNNVLVLDEPSNHCDQDTRKTLLKTLQSDNRCVILASHDRTLLNHMDWIIELTPLGLIKTHGNYDTHHQQRQLEKAAAQQQLQTHQQALNKGIQSIQSRIEKHQQAQAKGRRAKSAEIKAKGRYDKIGFKSQQGRSEKTNKKILTQANRIKNTLQTQLSNSASKIESTHQIKLSQLSTYVAKDKPIVTISDMSFNYNEQTLFKDFNLSIIGPKRAALTGNNGTGKSTLLKLIYGSLQPKQGSINLHISKVAYIDQETQRLSPHKTILENFCTQNPGTTLTEAYRQLDHFLFRAQRANTPCKDLSGGERIRALLAIELMQQPTPQLLLLDEPSNHLDIESLEVIERCLQHYNGALIVASHDKHFIESLHVTEQIALAPIAH